MQFANTIVCLIRVEMLENRSILECARILRKKKVVRVDVQSEYDFYCNCPGYEFSCWKSEALVVKNVLSKLDINQLIRSLAPSMVACTRAFKMNGEASRYPFVLEILKHFTRLSGDHYLSVKERFSCRDNRSDEDLAHLALEFEESMESDSQFSDCPWEVIVNWENYEAVVLQ